MSKSKRGLTHVRRHPGRRASDLELQRVLVIKRFSSGNEFFIILFITITNKVRFSRETLGRPYIITGEVG